MFLDGIVLTKEYVDEHLDEIKSYLTEAKRVNDFWDVFQNHDFWDVFKNHKIKG